MLNIGLKDNLCVVDIGTNKIITINYKISENGLLKIHSINHKKSEGIERSLISSKSKFFQTIKKSVLEDKNFKSSHLISSISDTKLYMKKNYEDLKIRGFKINKKDIRKIFIKNLKEPLSKDRTILHSFPKKFYIDGKCINHNPLGIECEKLGLGFTNLYVRNHHKDLIEKAFLQFRKKIKIDFVDSGLASGISCLTNTEKLNGATAVDIGAGSIKIVTFLNNNIEFLKNIPLGGNDVTNDIKKIVNLDNDEAEFFKIIHGTLNFENFEKIELNLEKKKKKIVSSGLLHGIIKPRYEEILEIIRDTLEENLISSSKMQNVVFTGGAVSIRGFQSFASNIINRKIRISSPKTNYNKINKPEFSTIDGLIKIHNDSSLKRIISANSWNQKLSFIEKIENWITESIN